MNNHKIAGFLAGVVCGTVVGLLTAPAKGAKTREKLLMRLLEMSDDLNNYLMQSTQNDYPQREDYSEPRTKEHIKLP